MVQLAHGDVVDSCRGSVRFQDPFRQFKELSCGGERREVVILAIQALDAVHVCVDHLNVVGHVGRLVVGVEMTRSFELENDGDLLALVREMVVRRGQGTPRITKVKEHASCGHGADGPGW